MKFTITINFGRWIEDWEEAGLEEEVYDYGLRRMFGEEVDFEDLKLKKNGNSMIISGNMPDFSIKVFEDFETKLNDFFIDILDSSYNNFVYIIN